MRKESSLFPRPALIIHSSIAQKLSALSTGFAMPCPDSNLELRKSACILSMARCPCAVDSSLEESSVIMRMTHISITLGPAGCVTRISAIRHSVHRITPSDAVFDSCAHSRWIPRSHESQNSLSPVLPQSPTKHRTQAATRAELYMLLSSCALLATVCPEVDCAGFGPVEVPSALGRTELSRSFARTCAWCCASAASSHPASVCDQPEPTAIINSPGTIGPAHPPHSSDRCEHLCGSRPTDISSRRRRSSSARSRIAACPTV